MYRTGPFEIWNLTPGVPAVTGAQKIFNVVGRLRHPHQVGRLSYSLNGKPFHPVFFHGNGFHSERLERPGDFNIDSIRTSEILPRNRMVLRLENRHGPPWEHGFEFTTVPFPESQPQFQLDLQGVECPEQVGQIVDGKWKVSRDPFGTPCLEVTRKESGYDRIILFGNNQWSDNYQVEALVCPTAFTGLHAHGVGLAFKWNPHRQGNGATLPLHWNTGVGFYWGGGPGLEITLGEDVHADEHGRPVGMQHLDRAVLSPFHRLFGRLLRKGLGRRKPWSQMVPRRCYRFRLQVHPDCYTLTIWKDGAREPAPQAVAPKPPEFFAQGSLGIIAHHCAMRLYELRVSPLEEHPLESLPR
ncbi:MAG: hypothetical protein ACE5H3_11360 [Planctomycetota bacterium]